METAFSIPILFFSLLPENGACEQKAQSRRVGLNMAATTSHSNPDSSQHGKSTNDLLPLVYDELRRAAQVKMANEGGVQTLSATALVHEAYLRISERKKTPQWENQRQFFGAAAEAMRRILIDRARAKLQIKRGGKQDRVELQESQIITPEKDDELLAVNEALEILESADPESAELVKLRYFAGMTWDEISKATGIPDRTLRRQWTYAKAWLQDHIKRS